MGEPVKEDVNTSRDQINKEESPPDDDVDKGGDEETVDVSTTDQCVTTSFQQHENADQVPQVGLLPQQYAGNDQVPFPSMNQTQHGVSPTPNFLPSSHGIATNIPGAGPVMVLPTPQPNNPYMHNLIPTHLQGNFVAQTAPAHLTHNLIPAHLQAQAFLGTQTQNPYGPVLIPPGGGVAPAGVLPSPPILTVQDRPLVPPVYNGVNVNYPGLQVLHSNPPIFAVENFLSAEECNFLIKSGQDSFGPAPVVGKGAGEVSASRTSSTCYLAREDLPWYMAKVTALTGKPVEHCELPQVGRYLTTQQYLQHFDAFDLSNEDGRRFASNGGQRTVTVLVYLNDVSSGGVTAFPAINLEVQPRCGKAVIFFPATVDGYLDKNLLHAALPAVDVKYVSQVWIRQGNYEGLPSKRLPVLM